MIQFTEKEILHIREKAAIFPKVLEQLKEDVKEVLAGSVLVPKTGIGNWYHYYFCPDCSVKLVFDRNDGRHHRCPSCGRVLEGEPYDSTWWWLVSMENYAAVLQMGLLYLATQEQDYARKAVEIMTEYGKYYRDYEVHGDIPYNGPGKAGAQTLDEANFLRSFAIAYDLLEGAMTREQKDAVKEGMLIPGAEFLRKHRHRQIHNHEVIINSAIGIIGLLFGREDYIREAVYEEYGILYQLEHGMLPNHMWFEGSFAYHFYALASFFTFEKFALHTEHSHIGHPNYRAMMELPFYYLEPGFSLPMLNDTSNGDHTSDLWGYEFAYREMGGEKLLSILNQLYRQRERNNPEAFFYGVDELPECDLGLTNYHVTVGESGCTILRGKGGRYLLFKHDTYGGEHDHYDRLSISYQALGRRISPDLGTTGYGALLHYDYYKNTGSHNTVMIGEENQAPVTGRLTRYEEKDGVVYAEAEADWRAPYQMPDSFTIVAWKEENYRKVKMERKIAWTEEYFAEVFTVRGADEELPVDWIMHFSGQMQEKPEGGEREILSEKKPYKYLHDVCQRKLPENGIYRINYEDMGVVTTVYGMAQGQELIMAQGPDNPSVSDISYLIERRFGKEAVFAHVIATCVWPDGALSERALREQEREGSSQAHSLEVAFEREKKELRIRVREQSGRSRELSFALF